MRKVFRGVGNSVIAPDPTSDLHLDGLSGPSASDHALARSRTPAEAAEANASAVANLTQPPLVSMFVRGQLITPGNAADNTIVFSRDAAGTILVNGGDPVVGGIPTVNNTTIIQAFGHDGDDVISVDESLGTLPEVAFFGGNGDDTLTGGSGNDQLFGQADNDTLLGGGGQDFLFGGQGDDVLVGGAGGDFMFGEAGNDRMIWNPGDGTDLMEGGAGIDTAEVNGGNGDEVFTTTANGTRVRFDRLDPAPFSIDIGTTENLVVDMGGGDDSFSATGNLAALINITVDGGAGNDTILGSNGQDLLIGGADDDFIDGQQGNDTAQLGAGDDRFQWDPGDGSDIVEGGEGTDTMLFNGSNGSEIFDASANGERLRFTRNLGNVVMDVSDLEVLEINALGGGDTIVVNDLSATDVMQVNIDLAGTLDGTAGDGAADTVVANATNEDETVEIVATGDTVTVNGLSAALNIEHVEGANDSLVINALNGDDTITAAAIPAGVVKLTLDGGRGNDTLLGSQDADVFLAGDDDDFVLGGGGGDVALLGAGDDLFQWDPGDGSDIVEGQTGFDELLFNGSGADESFDIFANGGRVTLFRNVGNVTMDLNDMEQLTVRTAAGSDNITIGDLTGTDVEAMGISLAGTVDGNTPDGALDTVTRNGSNNADEIRIISADDTVAITGLSADVSIDHADSTDRLIVNGLAGDDVIDATQLVAGHMELTVNAGLGDDIVLGSAGDDLINGGDGDDLALMGAGDDTFVWNPGDDNDILEGQAGIDTLVFNGNNVSENITIATNGGRALFLRDVANVLMDLNDVERINFNAQGGQDTIVINDLTGTDVTEVNINLANANGAGDAQPDTIIIQGTQGDDVVVVVGDDNTVTVLGLHATINITGFEAANDRIVINTFAGDDVVDASGLALGSIQLTADGGADNDILIGGAGNDVLIGGAGDDVLLGGPGIDILTGGDGDDIEIQLVGDNDILIQDGYGPFGFDPLTEDGLRDLADTFLLHGAGGAPLHPDHFVI